MGPERYNSLEEGLKQTWQIIGSDVMDCDPEFDETDSRAVAEIVLDANHLEYYGNVDPAQLQTFKEMLYEEQLEYASWYV